MAIEWCKYVNGTTIFLKLPVYLRMYNERWERNQRVKDAVKSSKTGLQLLQQVNDEHMLLPSGTRNRTSQEQEEDTGGTFDIDTVEHNDDGGDNGCATQEGEVPRFAAWVNVAAATAMSQPQYRAIQPHQQLGPTVVGGLLIGLTGDNSPTMRQKRKRGHRGKDAKFRKKRSCTRCLKCNGTRASD